MSTTSPSNNSMPRQVQSPARRRVLQFVVVVLVMIVLLVIGIVPRIRRSQEASEIVHANTVLLPNVIVIRPRVAPSQSSLLLPCNLLPLYSASIFARTNGYIEKRFVDIGSHVKAGQTLAIILTPEVDQQLNQGRADVLQAAATLDQSKAALQQAKANLDLARITRDRYAHLIGGRAVTQQSLDEADQIFKARAADVTAANANIEAAEANLTSRRANVERFVQLQNFESVVAPFDGVITARNVEQGDLVNDGSANDTKSLFRIAQSDVLRIQVEVPQSAALEIKTGQNAVLTVQERPGRQYAATVMRNAEAVDLDTRTMLTEVQVDNRQGSLVPGMYGEIKFIIPQMEQSFEIPPTALVIDKDGMHVVSVTSDDRVHLIPVGVGEDMGSQIEVSHGLHGGEKLVTNPSDLLHEGQKVSIAE